MPKVHVVEVQRHDGPLLLPKGLSLESAIAALEKRKEYESQVVDILEAIECFPWDGAIALEQALTEIQGEALLKSEGWAKANRIAIDVGPNQTRKVPWGRFTVDGVTGYIETGTTGSASGIVFQVSARTTHAFEDHVNRIIARTREIALSQSIYKGKALRVSFRDGDGDRRGWPEVSFIEPSKARPIFSRDLEEAIDAFILAPIRHSQECRDARVPLKRGTLLAGPYGTGKTLLASMVANEATANDWTYLYVTDCRELADALQFAKRFQPCVVFAEDVERIAGMDRTADVNALLNTLDGIGSKNDEIILVMTSNHAETVNPAMRRRGRIDLVLPIMPPDANACERLLTMYGKGILGKGVTLQEAGRELAGENPATVREAMERAKLLAIARTSGIDCHVIEADVIAAAKVLKHEGTLFAPKDEGHGPTRKVLADAFKVAALSLNGNDPHASYAAAHGKL